MADGIEYLVLGDLTAREDGAYVDRERNVIVRMFVGGKTYDEEITARAADLHDTIMKRRAQLKAKPNRKLLAEAEPPEQHPGHAVAVEAPE